MIVLGCLVAVIAPHANALKASVLPTTPPARLLPRLAMVGLLLIAAWAYTWWLADYNNRAPTKIDGIWTVAAGSAARSPWRRVFFEYNRAHMAVFRSAKSDEMHHFEIDGDGVVRIWQTWLSKGALIVQGRVRADGKIELTRSGDPASPLVFERDYTDATSWRQQP